MGRRRKGKKSRYTRIAVAGEEDTAAEEVDDQGKLLGGAAGDVGSDKEESDEELLLEALYDDGTTSGAGAGAGAGAGGVVVGGGDADSDEGVLIDLAMVGTDAMAFTAATSTTTRQTTKKQQEKEKEKGPSVSIPVSAVVVDGTERDDEKEPSSAKNMVPVSSPSSQEVAPPPPDCCAQRGPPVIGKDEPFLVRHPDGSICMANAPDFDPQALRQEAEEAERVRREEEQARAQGVSRERLRAVLNERGFSDHQQRNMLDVLILVRRVRSFSVLCALDMCFLLVFLVFDAIARIPGAMPATVVHAPIHVIVLYVWLIISDLMGISAAGKRDLRLLKGFIVMSLIYECAFLTLFVFNYRVSATTAIFRMLLVAFGGQVRRALVALNAMQEPEAERDAEQQV